MRLLVALFLVAVCLSTSTFAQSLGDYAPGVYAHDGKDGHELLLIGPIDAEMASVVKTRASGLTGLRRVRVHSDGGDVEAAMAIGTALRDVGALVHIPSQAKCYSSCILILAGGVQRWAEGPVGVHRPYYAVPTNATHKQWQTWFGQLRERVSAYLDSVNVSPSLFEEMQRTAPHEMRVLTQPELDAFGLVHTDPVYAEATTNQHAAKLGVSREEYERRRALVRERCEEPPPDDADLAAWNASMNECIEETMRSAAPSGDSNR